MGSFDPQAYGPHGASHEHPFTIPGMPELVQLAQALGGGMFPGMGSGQNDTMPNQDSVAPGFPLNLFFVVPANQVKQQAVKLTFQPSPYRTYISANAHNHPGDTVASDSTGGSSHQHAGDTVGTLSVTINNDSAVETVGHVHNIQANGLSGSADTLFFDVAVASRLSKNSVGAGQIISSTDQGVGSNDHYHTHAHSNNTHTHTPTNTGGEAAHNHGHGHTPGTTGNATQDGVHEGTSPDAMHVLVDGADVTANLGGPFTLAQTNLDISPYVAAGTGIHTVQVTSTTNLGRVSGWVRNSSIVNALSP